MESDGVRQSAADLFIKELLGASKELCFEFSQNDWESALIEGFRKDRTLAGVLFLASGFPDGKEMSGVEWDRLAARAALLKPSLRPNTSLRNRARVWIASHARFANEALWDMDYEKAKRLLKKGGLNPDQLRRLRRDYVRECTETVFVRARSLDKLGDWGVVK